MEVTFTGQVMDLCRTKEKGKLYAKVYCEGRVYNIFGIDESVDMLGKTVTFVCRASFKDVFLSVR